MIATAEIAVLTAAPAVGYAVDRWVAGWDRRLGEAAPDHGGTAAESRPAPLPAWVTIGLALAVAAIAVGVREGTFAALGAGLGWSLLALALVDRRHGLLPDALTLPLIAAGLIAAAAIDASLPRSEIIGAVAGFAALAGLRRLHWRWRGREGLGLGDAKLLAAAGAWLGWEALAPVVLLASLSALLFALPGAIASGRRGQAEIAFGPHLALAIWALWLYGPEGFL